MTVVEIADTVLVSFGILLHLVALDVGPLNTFLESQLVSHKVKLSYFTQFFT